MSPALPPAVYCTGGPLDGYGFTDKDWRRRLESARNLGHGPALEYRATRDAPSLSGRPKAAEALAGYAVTWMRWAP